MRLWTIQDCPAHQKLLEKGTLSGDWRRVEKFFKKPYQWLCWQMELREIRLKTKCPIWAWTHKPDMRTAGHSYRGDYGVVLLEIEVPDALVLLSHFGAWHSVLNDHYLVTCDAELERMFDHSQEEVEESWQKIFDCEIMAAIPGYDDWFQATFPTIEVDYIVKTREFGPR